MTCGQCHPLLCFSSSHVAELLTRDDWPRWHWQGLLPSVCPKRPADVCQSGTGAAVASDSWLALPPNEFPNLDRKSWQNTAALSVWFRSRTQIQTIEIAIDAAT